MWQEQEENPWEGYQLNQILLPAVHQQMSVTAPAAGESIQIWWCGREKIFTLVSINGPSVWFTAELFALYLRPAWLNCIFAPEILPTFTKAFLECNYQASLFTLLVLYLRFQHQICVHGMHNTHPEHEGRRRPWSLDLTPGLFPQCSFPLQRVGQEQCPGFGEESLEILPGTHLCRG